MSITPERRAELRSYAEKGAWTSVDTDELLALLEAADEADRLRGALPWHLLEGKGPNAGEAIRTELIEQGTKDAAALNRVRTAAAGLAQVEGFLSLLVQGGIIDSPNNRADAKDALAVVEILRAALDPEAGT